MRSLEEHAQGNILLASPIPTPMMERVFLPEFGSDELHALTRCVPSASLREDLLEMNDSMMHKAITALQIQMWHEFQAVCQKAIEGGSAWLKKHPKENQQMIVDKINEYLRKQRQEMKEKKYAPLIRNVRRKGKWQAWKIRQWCKKQPPSKAA